MEGRAFLLLHSCCCNGSFFCVFCVLYFVEIGAAGFDVVFFQFLLLCCGGMSVSIYLELHLLCMGIDC